MLLAEFNVLGVEGGDGGGEGLNEVLCGHGGFGVVHVEGDGEGAPELEGLRWCEWGVGGAGREVAEELGEGGAAQGGVCWGGGMLVLG